MTTPWWQSLTKVGNWTVVRFLGEGGMGCVLEGRHANGAPVAIKLLLPQYSQNAEIVRRFFNEGHAVRALDHPSIVKVFEIGQLADGMAYLVMEFLQGQTLTQRLAAGRMVAVAVRHGAAIAEALAYAHARGIVHRDLKPDNVMIVADPTAPGGERAKILDFGIAKIVEGGDLAPGVRAVNTRTGMVMGTPMYMSPEQCLGERGVGAKTDVYALGAMMYHLLSGRPPFTGSGLGEILMQQIRDMPPPLSQFVTGLPPQLEGLVRAMLAKQPDARPDMPMVAQQLRALNAPSETMLGGGSGGRRPVRRGRSKAPLIAILSAIVVAGGAVAGAWYWQQQDAAPVAVVPPVAPSNPDEPPINNEEESPPGGLEASKKVEWLIKSEPPGADIVRVRDHVTVHKTPWTTSTPAGTGGVDFDLVLSGYQTKRVTLDTSKDSFVRVKLDKKGR